MTDGPENNPPQDPSAFPPPGGEGGMPGAEPPQAPQTPPFDGGFQQPVYPAQNPGAQQYPAQPYQDPYAGYGGPPQDNKKVMAGVLAILLGGFGIHKFVLGYTKEGIIQIVLTIFTCGLASIIPLIEGIIYLTKSDDEFYQTYQVGQKTWF